MNINYKDYSKKYLSLESDNNEIVPLIIANGVHPDYVESYLGEVYPGYGKVTDAEQFANETFINDGKEYVRKYVTEANKKYNSMCDTWNRAYDAADKAKKSSKTLSIIISIITVAALVISFI